EQFSTVISHYEAGGVINAAEFGGTKIVNKLDLGSGVNGSIDAGSNARELVIHSAKGNTVANSLAPEIVSDSGFTLTGDLLALTKIGEGDQKISIQTGTGGTVTVREGELILSNTAAGGSSGTIFTNSGIRSATSFVDIQGSGTLQVASATGSTDHEWMRYVTSGDSSTSSKLAFGDGDFNVELGLDLATDGIKAFTGMVVTPDTATNTGTINVSQLTGWQQVGRLSGGGDIKKTGSGILEITGSSNPGTAFSGDMKLDGGTLIVSDAAALNSRGIGGNSGDFDRGKFSVKTGTTFADNIDTTGATGKTMIGGTGIFNKAIVINDGVGVNTFRELDPGLAASSSLSDVAAPGSGYQVVQSPGNTIGSFTAAGLDWQAGGIFNWEIQDMDTSGTAGTDWDLFSFTGGTALDLTIQGRKINIFGITKTGFGAVAAGAGGTPDDWGYPSGTNEYKFMEGSFSGAADGATFNSDYFDIDDSQFNWLMRDWNGVWGVKYNSNALYLTYSVVPEPSTYVMVVGAFFLPVWNFFRRRRASRKDLE
ncbi:MAG: hypothetical protein VB980_02205, partial [Opitutales bacterium]